MLEVDRIIRAWKDEDFRLSLSDVELAMLPESPAGMVEFSNSNLSQAAGDAIVTLPACPTFVACSPLCPITLIGCITVRPPTCS
jgi:mersacidin/lichenicidin family type 2 lantibiotic